MFDNEAARDFRVASFVFRLKGFLLLSLPAPRNSQKLVYSAFKPLNGE